MSTGRAREMNQEAARAGTDSRKPLPFEPELTQSVRARLKVTRDAVKVG